ncbi:hypothetical protein LWM68_26230 [Niabella sp. W65]|nr:hypothetical protein [Niabella sp. W65]MCH7365959.1 hypothetical protein [Niabella sp. W65]ULT41694.1 hypothetical protein KRR40_45130 [Niabella sp. I65]
MLFKKPLILTTGILITSATAFGQPVKVADVTKTISFLASDEMKGRAVYSPEIDKAAEFIASEFKKAGLQPLAGSNYLQSFVMVSATQLSINAQSGDKEIDPKNVVALTSKPALNFSSANVQTAGIRPGDNLFSKAFEYAGSNTSLLVTVDESFSKQFQGWLY